eukprot:CAMPEP_0171455304 /NCGR_PEP_ID=MMETSP0945-20130129/2252_1 /TAXON_ID=109269 /ORGANISM="Vaucheria litorea, Strain CCMP2940" /LENGTH=95 /DNA_ID=CAMNT_0011980517 /DNA_START=126 /DNA_END=413 /DNA_ORIENTATION=+
MVGGWSDVTNEMPETAQSVVDWVLVRVKGYEGVGESAELTVVSVRQQVVAGMNYDVSVKSLSSEGECQMHEVVVYYVPWKNEKTITKESSMPCDE